MKGRSRLAVAGLALLTVCSGVTYAAGSKCSSAKIKSAGKKVAGRGKCFVKAISKNIAVDGACLSKAHDGLSKGFGKAEPKADCLAPTGDLNATESLVDAFIDTLRSHINGSAGGPSKCDSKKLAAATKKASGKAGCQAKAVGKGIPVDAACLSKIEGKFGTAIGKAESGDDCTSTGQAAVLEADVDAFISNLMSALAPPPGPTTTTTITTTTTTIPGPVCGNGTIEGPTETCDDHNTVDESTVDTLPPDPCPANCRIESCPTPGGTLSVSVNFSSAASVAGYKVFVDYPENKVTIPGIGQPGAGVITNDPTASATANDLDYGLIVVAGGLNAIPPSRLFTINFTGCGSTPTAAEFHCKVHQASDPNGNDIPMTCSVSIP